MPRPAPQSPLVSDELVASIVADVRRAGGIPRARLPKLSAKTRPVLDDALRAAGVEVTRSAIRIPLRSQLLSLLAKDAVLDEKGIGKRLSCVAAPEAKRAIAALIADGEARRVERLTGPALALPSEPVIGVRRAVSLTEELDRALKWLRRAARPSGRGRIELLEGDVAALLDRLSDKPSVGATLRVEDALSSLLDRMTRTAVQLAAQHGGLAPVPSLVRALGVPTADAHAAMREGHSRGWLELQPESSMGRLGAEELALCLPGPEGTRLSWVRLTERGHSHTSRLPGASS